MTFRRLYIEKDIRQRKEDIDNEEAEGIIQTLFAEHGEDDNTSA